MSNEEYHTDRQLMAVFGIQAVDDERFEYLWGIADSDEAEEHLKEQVREMGDSVKTEEHTLYR